VAAYERGLRKEGPLAQAIRNELRQVRLERDRGGG
jgi:hypothetical protein